MGFMHESMQARFGKGVHSGPGEYALFNDGNTHTVGGAALVFGWWGVLSGMMCWFVTTYAVTYIAAVVYNRIN